MMEFTSEQKFEIARLYSQHYVNKTVGMLETVPNFQYSSPRNGKIRLGYMSWDFANHPLAHLMQSIFGMHDRDRFEIVAFSLRQSDSSKYRIKIEEEVDEFIQIEEGASTLEIATLVNERNIQILFNLNGWTMGERNDVFVLRPAPI